MAKKVDWNTQESRLVNVSEIKLNPRNPRSIRDHKFKKLVKSIKDFPEMLEMRPLVVDEDMVILGGNMRFKALCEAGLNQVHVIQLLGLSKEKKDEFVIKDNASYGEWDWDALANNFDDVKLGDWGLDVWQPNDSIYSVEMTDEDEDYDSEGNEITDVGSGSESKDRNVEPKKVIQIEFQIGDYNEAFGLVNLLRSKKVNIGEVLIQTMKKMITDEN
jgi:hypothetical protein